MRKNIEWEEKENGCWEITSHAKNRKDAGYCKFHRYGRKQFVHRYIYEECFGEIPKGMCVMHKCDNSSCINPEHLTLGTNKENTQDKVNKGRQLKGSKNPMAKLKEDDVLRIKKMLENEHMVKEIAEKFNISRQTVTEIKQGRNWRWLNV